LGVKDIGRFNKVLLAKWMWRLGVESKGKWGELLL